MTSISFTAALSLMDFDDFEERPPNDGLLLDALLILCFEIEPVPIDDRGVFERFIEFICCTLGINIIYIFNIQSQLKIFYYFFV
jgi:hypothetical protein